MNKPPLKKIPKDQIPEGASLCDYCTAKCCRYFALPIEEPTEARDFDFMRWFLLHERASVFVDEEVWYILVHTKCKHLQDDNRCGIYHTRPEICREYSTDNCEYEDSNVYDRYFETAEQVHEYYEALFENRPTAKNFRSPRPEMFPILN